MRRGQAPTVSSYSNSLLLFKTTPTSEIIINTNNNPSRTASVFCPLCHKREAEVKPPQLWRGEACGDIKRGGGQGGPVMVPRGCGGHFVRRGCGASSTATGETPQLPASPRGHGWGERRAPALSLSSAIFPGEGKGPGRTAPRRLLGWVRRPRCPGDAVAVSYGKLALVVFLVFKK